MLQQEEEYISGSHDEDNEMVVPVAAGSPMDIASLLRNDFHFTKLTPEEAVALPKPSNIYDAPYGLKEGIVADLV
jgi:hypothetical protein